MHDDFKVDPEYWKNIPYAVTTSFSVFKQCHENSSRILAHLVADYKKRITMIQRSLLEQDRKFSDEGKVLSQRTETQFQNNKHVYLSLEKQLLNDREQHDKALQDLQFKLRKEFELVDRLVQDLKKEKAEVERTKQLTRDVRNELLQRVNSLQDQILNLNQAIGGIRENNLLVPGLVGKDCRYSNLKEYVRATTTRLTELEEFAQNTADRCREGKQQGIRKNKEVYDRFALLEKQQQARSLEINSIFKTQQTKL